MAPERLLASFLLRVAFRDGRREVRLQPVAGGRAYRFGTYDALAEHLATLEDADGRRVPDGGEGGPDLR